MARAKSKNESPVMATALPRELADQVKAEAKECGRTWSRHIRSIIESHFAELDRQAGESR